MRREVRSRAPQARRRNGSGGRPPHVPKRGSEEGGPLKCDGKAEKILLDLCIDKDTSGRVIIPSDSPICRAERGMKKGANGERPS